MKEDIKEVENALHRLHKSIQNGGSSIYCLRRWSEFIRMRDQNRCVICHTRKKLNAHHIIRKSFMEHLRYQTGNGITLCGSCHKFPHKKFNRKPDLSLPMDQEGGENIDLLTGFFGSLVIDAKERGIDREDFYYIDDAALYFFRATQGIPEAANFPGSRIEQAYAIWNQTPRPFFESMLGSFGVEIPEEYIQQEAVSLYKSKTIKKEDGRPAEVLYIRYAPPPVTAENLHDFDNSEDE